MLRFSFSTLLLATPASADPGEYGHMAGWGYGNGVGMMFGPVLWLIVLGLVVAGVIWSVGRFDHGAPRHGKTKARDELDMRFARGEIDAEEYSSRKKLLET
jgi:putative membrane protein